MVGGGLFILIISERSIKKLSCRILQAPPRRNSISFILIHRRMEGQANQKKMMDQGDPGDTSLPWKNIN